jgi:MFS family permease
MQAGCVLPIYLITGGHNVEITDEPNTRDLVLLAIFALTLPTMSIVGWLVSRLGSSRARAIGAAVSVAIAAGVGLIAFGTGQLTDDVIFVALVLILTASGVGSVAGWAVRMMFSHLASAGALAVRALPVVLLTALVFFNSYAWLMAATITGDRLGLAMAFLMLIAALFVISTSRERLEPMLRSTAVAPEDAELLADTPFATMPDAPDVTPLKKAERLNVVFVLAASQLAQILMVAMVTAAIYVILGLIVLSPSLLNEWTHTYTSTATVLGFTLPVPDSLIHMCLFLAALTFMYVSARAAGDDQYRTTFLAPLIADLRTTLVARNRYRGAVAAAASDLSGKRYGEVLLVTPGDAGPTAAVYNSFPLNDCPAELWSALDPQAIATENGAAAALLNGPRYWLMNAIEKTPQGPQVTKTFGGIEMIQQATVLLSSMNPTPYSVNEVSRHTVFVFNAGEQVYELIDPDGQRWAMQSWSQVADPNLSRADLPGLASRLNLPGGWTYQPRVLTSELRIDTTTRPAHVTQDDLTNSYSLEF